MISNSEAERVNPTASEFNRYSIRLWIVLSLIFSLAASVILSKRQLVGQHWIYAVALLVPISLTLFFRNRIVQFGPFVYVAALVLLLIAAIFFGL